MEFFLPFTIPPFPFTISYQTRILFIGSCFSQEIGDRMASLKFDVIQNPNGILYNPLSIEKAISSYIANKVYSEDELIQANGVYHSFQHHSSFSGLAKRDVLEKINQSQNNAHHFLKKADVLIITFGTAFCYEWRNNDGIVANCHKFPAEKFQKRLLKIKETEEKYFQLIEQLKLFNPALKIIFTISPVKHMRDGVVENVRSKARLIEAVHAIVSQYPNTFYFPSYELVTEVLRDYRFYKADLVHPNQSAADFVFQKFCDSFFDPATVAYKKELESIMQMINHRPLFKQSSSHAAFKNSLINKIGRFESDYPLTDFSTEKEKLLQP